MRRPPHFESTVLDDDVEALSGATARDADVKVTELEQVDWRHARGDELEP